jgi:hypothetical protein
MMEKKGWRAECGGHAMSDVFFYLLVVVIAFGVYYSIYGLGTAAIRLIRSLYECEANTRWRPPGKM